MKFWHTICRFTVTTLVLLLAQNAGAVFAGESRWTLDETAGLTAADGISGNTGSYNGVMLGQIGPCNLANTAVQFDGNNDYIEIPHIDGYLLDAGSMSMWVQPTSISGRQELFSKDSSDFDTGGHVTIYINSSGAIQVRMQSTTTSYGIVSSGQVVAGSWFHLTYTWGSAGMRLYIDGVLAGSNAYTGGFGTSSGGSGNFEPIAIGANAWASDNLVVTPLRDYFEGKIANVRLLDTALSEKEVAALQPCTVSSRWLLDETMGTEAIDSLGSNNGTYNNGVNAGSKRTLQFNRHGRTV